MNRIQTRRSRYSVLADFADLLRDLFVAKVTAKNSRQGSRTAKSLGEKADWPGIAAFVFDRSLPAAPWVHYVVTEMRFPQGNHLKSPKILNRYNDTDERRRQVGLRQVAEGLNFDKRQSSTNLAMVIESHDEGDFEQKMSKEDLIGLVLADDTSSLSPLFRYCWAVDADIPDLANSYFVEALFQYVITPDAYDEVWANWISTEFKREARTLFQPPM